MSVFLFNEQTGELALSAHPIDNGFPVTSAQLIELLELSDYCEFEVLSGNIGKLFSPSKNYQQESLVIAKATDASIVINVDEKKHGCRGYAYHGQRRRITLYGGSSSSFS